MCVRTLYRDRHTTCLTTNTRNTLASALPPKPPPRPPSPQRNMRYRSHSLLGFRVFCTAAIDHECRMQSTSVCLSISSSSITAQHTHAQSTSALLLLHISSACIPKTKKMCLRFAQSRQQDTHTTPLPAAAVAAANHCILCNAVSREFSLAAAPHAVRCIASAFVFLV